MTRVDLAAIASGLALGYWLVAVFLPHLRRDPEADREAARERAEGFAWPGTAVRPWHMVLGVRPDATAAEVTAAYEARRREYAPARLAAMEPDLRALAEGRARELDDAYRAARR
ncbi:MAG: hypothetical protein ACTHKZ_05685 [Lysobacteraceae bacterium]